MSDLRRLAGSQVGIGVSLALTGLLIWSSVSVWAGLTAEAGFRLREAWDVPAYFYVGLPIMALAALLAGFAQPERLWRWPLWLVAGHQIGVLLFGIGMQSGLSLVILTIILGILLAVGLAVPALAGAVAARALAHRAY